MEASRIVVGLDNSAASAAALRWAIRHTRAGGVVVAVSVCGMRTPKGSTDLFHTVRLRLVDDAVTRMGPNPSVRVEQSVLDGEPGPTLVELAGEADSLVLGRHGYSRGGMTIFGSVIRHCLEHATCPVVVVPVEEHQVA
ncbi:universal stress protein [Saccharothrix sp. 6-C]|uniref:Nucleotide-binding universal stress UspA family protein n=1 Tax=Saccharothrix texasensis TaxID=103734 RepID=A0A3N1GZU0_9PSEU|nr:MULTISPECIES: universal stress protein [Saccharothrix]QQQ79421.1 universal stress protein [Saccharothrix sp. 6-C]ROP35758.1 nucleotide-binding universal stress UspA family protein [Saccharothrix texasensis]